MLEGKPNLFKNLCRKSRRLLSNKCFLSLLEFFLQEIHILTQWWGSKCIWYKCKLCQTFDSRNSQNKVNIFIYLLNTLQVGWYLLTWHHKTIIWIDLQNIHDFYCKYCYILTTALPIITVVKIYLTKTLLLMFT